MEENFTPYDYSGGREQKPQTPPEETYNPYSYTYGEKRSEPVKQVPPTPVTPPPVAPVTPQPTPVQYGYGYKVTPDADGGYTVNINYPENNQARPVMTEIQPNGIPVKPRKEEKKFIKRTYNITGWMLIINSVLPYILVTMFSVFYLLFTEISGELPYGIDKSIQMSFIVLIYIISDFFIVFLGNKLTGIKLGPLFNTKGFSASFLLMGTVIAIGMNLLAIMVSSLTETAFEELFGLMLVSPDNTPSSMIYRIVDCVYAVIIAPIIEEIVFRGFVLKNFSRYNVYTGIVLSGLFFGLMHGNFYQFIFTVPFGMALAYMTVKSNSILPAIFAHFLANAGVTVINLIGLHNEDLSDGIFVAWLAFFICLGLLMLFIGLATKSIRLPKNTKAEKKRGFPLAFTSHAVIIYIVIQIISCITSIEKL